MTSLSPKCAGIADKIILVQEMKINNPEGGILRSGRGLYVHQKSLTTQPVLAEMNRADSVLRCPCPIPAPETRRFAGVDDVVPLFCDSGLPLKWGMPNERRRGCPKSQVGPSYWGNRGAAAIGPIRDCIGQPFCNMQPHKRLRAAVRDERNNPLSRLVSFM